MLSSFCQSFPLTLFDRNPLKIYAFLSITSRFDYLVSYEAYFRKKQYIHDKLKHHARTQIHFTFCTSDNSFCTINVPFFIRNHNLLGTIEVPVKWLLFPILILQPFYVCMRPFDCHGCCCQCYYDCLGTRLIRKNLTVYAHVRDFMFNLVIPKVT